MYSYISYRTEYSLGLASFGSDPVILPPEIGVFKDICRKTPHLLANPSRLANNENFLDHLSGLHVHVTDMAGDLLIC